MQYTERSQLENLKDGTVIYLVNPFGYSTINSVVIDKIVISTQDRKDSLFDWDLKTSDGFGHFIGDLLMEKKGVFSSRSEALRFLDGLVVESHEEGLPTIREVIAHEEYCTEIYGDVYFDE